MTYESGAAWRKQIEHFHELHRVEYGSADFDEFEPAYHYGWDAGRNEEILAVRGQRRGTARGIGESSQRRARLVQVHELDTFLTRPPEVAARAIVRAIERRRPRLIIGADARAATFLQWLMPVRYWRVIRLAYAKFLTPR